MFTLVEKKETTITPAMIQADFLSSEDTIMQELNEILNKIQDTKEAELGLRAQKLGFNSSKLAVEKQQKEIEKENAQRKKEAIEKYRIHYPQYKFIDEQTAKKLCEKYSLVLGNAGQYKGEIPEKNLEEMERFIIKAEDARQDESDIINLWIQNFINPPIQQPNLDGFAMRYDPYSQSQVEHPKGKKGPFRICAPIDQMNTSGYEMKDGYKLVWDPIVLQPVKEGYLIVTAWGQEASDPEVINEAKN